MAQPTLTEINDKLDRLLRYQRNQRILAWLKGIVWLAILVIVLGGPVYLFHDFYNNPRKYFDPAKLQQYQKQAEQLMKQFQK